ncbi:phoenix isoform X3 [Ctenopharyngodon idella]|uniref:phoenix isoform X3 n=1 Tax=Ctenopharyngodon idella TaxID=7959 RepID=UPI0022329115|nr:phoenix isoform X3 [Ctenopharyngodon idella]
MNNADDWRHSHTDWEHEERLGDAGDSLTQVDLPQLFDSGESLFVTQSVTKAVRTERRHRPSSISDDIGDDSKGVTRSLSENEDNEYEEGREGQHVVCPNRGKWSHYFPPQKATFPFLLKSHRRQHLTRKKHQILENSEIGGFLKCMKKFEEGYVKTERAISPYMLESELSDNSEGDDHSSDHDHNSDHEVTKVDKMFVPNYCKGNLNKKWLPQSILERRIQNSLSKDNKEQLLNVNGKGKKRKTKSTKKNQTSVSVKKQSKKKCKVPKSKAVARTLSESSCISLCEEQGKQHETHEVLASCSDAEHSDSSNCGQPLNKQIIQCAENSHGSNLVVIEETQTHAVEAVSRMEHEDDMRSGTDSYLPNKSNFVPPQGGDISVQNEIQHTDSDIGSMDLFSSLNSQEHKNNQIHKTASITANIEESDQDSDVTQIETEGQSESIFGPGTPRWCDGEHRAHEDDESDITQIETEGEYVSVFGPRTPTKQFTIQDVNSTKLSESQKTGQSSVVLHTELFSRREDKTRHKKKKKKTKSSFHKDTEVTGIEETVTVQPSSKHLPLANEPLREVYSSSCEHVIVGKQRRMVEMETDTQDSPLFKNGGMSFLKRKRKGKKKMGAAILMECDTDVDVSQKVSSEFQADVAELKTTCRENRELFDVENRVTNEEQTATSVLQSEEASELLEEIILSTFADSSVIKKAKKKKMKMYKLKEREDAEPGVENQSVEAVQFNQPQTTELTLKSTKKKKRRKDKERTKTAYVEENSATDIPSNGTLDSDRPTELRVNEGDQSSEAPEAGQPKHMQTSEEIAGSLSPNVTRLKSVKKKKKKRDETESQYESVDLNVSSMSQFDAGLRVVEQQEDQVIEERRSNDNAAEHLEGNTASILKVAKRKKKRQNVSSPSQSNDVIGPEKQVSCMQSENAAEPNNLGSDDIVITKDKQKKAKKQKLKERKTIELASDIKDIVQIQYSESQTTDMLSRGTKKKRANKDRERTVSSSNKHLEHMDDRPPEMRGINAIQSNEATETDQIEHLQSSEGITRYKSPSITVLSSGKKKKKKRDQSEERQYESVDLNLDVSSVSQFDVTALRAQKMIKRRQSDAAENFEGNAAHILNVAKRKRKSQNASAPSQIVDIIGLENAVSDSQSTNTAELVEKANSSGLSDNTLSSKYKRNKKKKHKIKEQEDAEPNAVTHSVDSVHSIETDQFNESQTTELTLKRTKKKRKDKERKKTSYIEENGTTDILSIETFEAIETDHLEHLQTSEQTEQCPSPNVTRLKSVKKKKKKNGSEECQYEPVDFALDVSLVSQFDNVTHRSNTQTVEERPNDVEHLESNTEAKLNDTKHKKKRKRSSFSIDYNSDFNSSAAQMRETVTPERKMKKKRF